MKQRLYLRKNDLSENPKLPYFTLFLPPVEGQSDGEWREVGALWKAKNGKGYTGMTTEAATITINEELGFKKKPKPEEEQEPELND